MDCRSNASRILGYSTAILAVIGGAAVACSSSSDDGGGADAGAEASASVDSGHTPANTTDSGGGGGDGGGGGGGDDDDDDDDVVDAGPDADADAGSADAGDAGNGFPPTSLPVDCRLEANTAHDGMNGSPYCKVYQGTPGLGAGPKATTVGNGAYLSGFYDPAASVFYLAGARAIVKVARASGDRTVVSGVFDDPANGKKTVGTGPSWPESSIIAINPAPNGKIFVMAGDGIYLVDPADGKRKLQRDYTGVPAQNQIRLEGAFDADATPNFFFAITRKASGGGVGILELSPGGASTVVTLSGATDTARNKGAGVSYDVAGYNAVRLHAGKVFMLNGDDDNLASVEPASGDRTIVSSSKRGVGTDTDGYTHGLADEAGGWLLIDATHNTAYTFDTKVDLTNGNRAFACPYFTDVIEAKKPENAIGGIGLGIHIDPASGILYDVVGSSLRALDLASGNFNYVMRE